MTIRSARPEDSTSLADLAALDSARPLGGDHLLVAQVGGALIAAIDPRTGRAIADPLTPSAQAVDLLRLRAEQMRAAERPARYRRRHLPAAIASILR